MAMTCVAVGGTTMEDPCGTIAVGGTTMEDPCGTIGTLLGATTDPKGACRTVTEPDGVGMELTVGATVIDCPVGMNLGEIVCTGTAFTGAMALLVLGVDMPD